MNINVLGRFFIFLPGALGVIGMAGAGDWVGTLQDGTLIRVDPDTHKAFRYSDHGSELLWNGVHQMDDGSVVIIREGVAVPEERMLDAWQGRPAVEGAKAGDFCLQLVRKTCGFHSECRVTESCNLARQLQRMQIDEERRMPFAPGMEQITEAAKRCREALADDAGFGRCEKVRPMARITPCVKLAKKVCGEHGQCQQAESCDVARQLARLEQQDRLQSDDPDAPTASAHQCREAFNNSFFAPCGLQ